MMAMMEGRIDRRAFLRGSAATGAAVALGGLPGPASATPGPARRRAKPARDGRFRQAVASGEPRPRSIRLWTRVDEIERSGTVELEVAKDAGFDNVVERRRVLAKERRDFTVHAKVKGLEPGERYFYRFDTGPRSSPVGQFRTLPPRDSRQPIRIGIYSCQDWEAGYYTAHAGLAEEDLDLVVCLGDYIYERSFYGDDSVREDTLGANGDGEVQTLGEYRQKYALYHSDPNLKALRRAHSMLAIWDDHEVEDNYAGDLPGAATQDPRVEFIKRRRSAYRAYFEQMPFAPAKTGGNGKRRGRRNHRALRLGRNAELILLDQRKYRDDQPCGDDIPPVPPCPPEERNDPSRTLLGADQKQWFKRRLRRSDATWKLIGNQAMAMALDVPANNPLNMDQWDGYGGERQELCEFIVAEEIADVSFLTGDIHTFFSGVVTPTGRQTAPTTPAAVATEFVAGSMTSLGIPETINGTTGVPLPPEITAILADEAGLAANNPHYRYSNSEMRGYGIVEAREDELLVTYRAPDSTQSETSPVNDLETFRVASGTPEVEVT
jgi:alkaline phosphatase D